MFGQVFRQVLRHPLRQGGDQHAPAARGDGLAFVQQIVDLMFDRAYLGDRIDQAGRTDHLFGEHAGGALHLPRSRRGGDEHRHRPEAFPFLELQRPVVDAGRQAEAELRQHGLAVEVAAIHAADLRHRDVAFVDDQQCVFRQVFEQRRRRVAGLSSGQVARVVLDPLAGAGRLHHFDIERGALFQPLRFQQFARWRAVPPGVPSVRS